MSKSTFTLNPSPVLFDISTRENEQLAARVERVALEHIELAANPRREIGEEGIDRLAKMLCSSGQLVPCIGWRPDPRRAEGAALRRPAPLPRRPGKPRPRRQRVHGRPRRARAQPDRAAARPRPDERGGPAYPGPLPAARRAHALRPAAAVRGLLAGSRRPARSRPDRRRLRRPRHLPETGAQPSPPAHPARADPHSCRRAPCRRADLGDDGQQARRHARARPAAHRGGRQADHHQRPARQGAGRPRRVRAPHRRRGRAHLRRSDRRRRPARRRRADRPRPPATERRRTAATRGDPRLRGRAARPRARRARRPRQGTVGQDPDHLRDPRPRPQRPLRLRPRPRSRLRRRHLGHRPRVHDRPRPAAPPGRRSGARLARRRTSPARASTTTSCATPPTRTSSAAPRRAPATPRRPAATSGSGTTSAPG